MKCPTCVEEGTRSIVYDRGSSITLLGHRPFYDEDGVYHNHNPNNITTVYGCSNGHRFSTKHKPDCPVGDYP